MNNFNHQLNMKHSYIVKTTVADTILFVTNDYSQIIPEFLKKINIDMEKWNNMVEYLNPKPCDKQEYWRIHHNNLSTPHRMEFPGPDLMKVGDRYVLFGYSQETFVVDVISSV